MSSDNQFTALGPANIGFQTNSASINVGADIAGSEVGVRGHCDSGDGVVGISDANDKSGVFGFHTKQTGAAFGVFGACNAPDGAGVAGDSGPGNGVRGHSVAQDGVVGISDANKKSGVFGVNSQTSGLAFGVSGMTSSPDGAGVFGFTDVGNGVVGVSKANTRAGVTGRNDGELLTADFGTAGVAGFGGSGDGVIGIAHKVDKSGVFGSNDQGPGVFGNSRSGTGVNGQSDTGTGVFGHSNTGSGVAGASTANAGVQGTSQTNDGVVGTTTEFGKSGVFGTNHGSVPATILAHVFGVTGRADSPAGFGVSGDSAEGTGILGNGGHYGGLFEGGKAPMRLVPSSTTGAPPSGIHERGEFFVDSEGSLFYCKTNGTPGTWVALA
jgi:hypothetical protein